MACEAKRGCGYRKAGALYIVTDGLGEPCERLPIELGCCPTCGGGIKQTRSFQWMKTALLFENPKLRPCAMATDAVAPPGPDFDARRHCPRCVVCTPGLIEAEAQPSDKVGLIWVGEKFYKRPEDWSREAAALGVSRRLSTIPKGLVVGKSWIFAAHPKAIRVPVGGERADGALFDDDKVKYMPGVFYVFRPSRIELIVTSSMKKEDWVTRLVEKQGVTLVEVPEDDPDHAPSKAKRSAWRAAMDRAAEKAREETPA